MRLLATLAVIAYIWTSLVGLCAVTLFSGHAVAQNRQGGDSEPVQNVMRLIESEEKTGEWIFYNQRFLDKEKKWAEYRGSVYAAVEDVKIEGCRTEWKTVVVDHFTGVVGKAATGEQQDRSLRSISFTLTKEIAKNLQVIEARPIQLRNTTNAVCDEKPSCKLIWLRISTVVPKITETVVTNDQMEFSGPTALVLLPVSSSEVGSGLIQQLQTLANSLCP